VQGVRLNSRNANELFSLRKEFSNPQAECLTINIPPGGFVEVSAHAKINLFLAIKGKRNKFASDGYHELASVMQRIALRDSIKITAQSSVSAEILLTANGENNANLPTDSSNLCVKAAELIMRTYGITAKVCIELTKRIPMGAGLGGGSSDSAATLLGLDQLFGLNIPMRELLELGTTLGADVPFCVLANGHANCSTALAGGIGEILTPLPSHPPCYIVLASPPIHISTANAFGKLQLQKKSAKLAQQGLEQFMAAYCSGDIRKIAQRLHNTFTPVTHHAQEYITALLNHGALGAQMTGTGSTVYGYFDCECLAKTACDILGRNFSETKFCVTQVT